ncbi:hypothetical protein K449DRAFT_430262 [Hypoxylon sp. EC38]|nr:hypothetical protein K449DRAFT_430262 [Hypoxylon sp. EC38]
MYTLEKKEAVVKDVLAQISEFNKSLQTWEENVKSEVLPDNDTEEMKKWLEWQWESHNTLRLFDCWPTSTQLRGDLSRASNDLDRLEARIRRLQRKNEEKKREKERQREEERKDSSKKHTP